MAFDELSVPDAALVRVLHLLRQVAWAEVDEKPCSFRAAQDHHCLQRDSGCFQHLDRV